MELYFGTPLPQQVLNSLEKVSDDLLEDLRLWNKSKEEIIQHIDDSCVDGLVYIAYRDGVSLLYMDKTPYTISMTILASPDYNKNKIARFITEVMEMFSDKTDIHKIEVFTACPDIHYVMKKCGFVQEGTLVDSRRVPTGEFVDEFCYGYLIDV